MPFPGTRVVHPRWGAQGGGVSDAAMNAHVRILEGTAAGWSLTSGPVAGADVVVYDGPARVSYDLDRPFTKDNADQVTTTATVLVALPRTAAPTVMPVAGMTGKVDSVDDNGLSDFSESTLRVLHTRRSGLSFGIVMDCSEMVGRTNG